MIPALRRLLLLLPLCATHLCAPARAQPPGAALPPDPVMAMVHADDWAQAAALAATYPDPVAAKLVTFYRLLAPNAATADEIAAFRAANPDWPFQPTLARRLEEAAAAAPDDSAVLKLCATGGAHLPATLLRCAQSDAIAGRPAESAAMANAAWEAGDDRLIARMAPQFAGEITARTQWRRFARLAWSDTAATTRQLARLDPADLPRATAWLALRHDAPAAEALFDALPPDQQRLPGLMLERARFLRRANRDDDAVAWWLAAGTQAEAAASADHRPAFWGERNLLARRRLRQGDADGAYRLAAGHAQTSPEQIADAEFLAGFIALRKLNNPAAATPHFQRLADVSKAAITQGRAHYWLARAGGGAAEYAKAAAWPDTFYGQLAILALGQTLPQAILADRAPLAPPDRALALAEREVARAAAYLVGWGEPRRAEAFLLRLDEISPDTVDRRLAARLALGLGLPQAAVAMARRAGTAGVIEIDSGWPVAAAIPPEAGLDPDLALGIIRQESSFDPGTVSPVGARGLMQLMPATATLQGRKLGLAVPIVALTTDTALNLRLGSFYLRSLLDQFGGVEPYAIAAYNAGPGHIGEWIAAAGDPPNDGSDMIDWIEQIPFGETRNYVQRVIENQVVYAALTGSTAPHPLAKFLK
jgi:soluble lytic murein transglycosylase